MSPEARRLADHARRQIWGVALALVLLEVLLAILASLVMSGRIATPIISEREKAREEQERLNREMEIASKIQTCLLPPVPTVEDFDLALAMVPAEEVGGDFVDVLGASEPGAFWLGIGDVTGHGLTPGLIMMMAQSTFNAFARTPGATPKSVYDGMNRVMYQNIKDRLKTGDHMTMSILKHEGDGAFVHCGCHLDLLIYRAETATVERVATEGPWIGLLPECSDFTRETRFALGPQDVLVVYTDGLIELQDAHQEQWDMERLCASLARHAHRDATTIQQAIVRDALRWSAKVLDDISLIVVKRGASELTQLVPQADDRPAALSS
jgi:serine phosphatase RsbU (regulator of sigma subunit)